MSKKTSGEKLPKQIGNKSSERNFETVFKIVVPKKDENKNQELLKNLEAISDEDIMKMGEEIVALKKEREEREKREIIGAQELRDFREAWKEKIKDIGEIKEKIIETVENIHVKIEKGSDGSRLIEFELGGKKWKILDPKIENHSDEKYKYYKSCWYYGPDFYKSIRDINDGVTLEGMRGSNLGGWKNRKLAEYVEQKEQEGLHIPSVNEVRGLWEELGKKIDSDNQSNQIAMLMYLTGMDGRYWLDVGDVGDASRGRLSLSIKSDYRCLVTNSRDSVYSNLCMIACE